MLYRIPARALVLFGYRSEFLTDTRGTGIMHHRFPGVRAWAGTLATRARDAGVDGEWHDHRVRLAALQERSTLFVSPGEPVYEGMIVGENLSGRHGRESDQREEAHEHADDGNGREHSSEPPRELTLEGALEYIEDDELIEVTRARFDCGSVRAERSEEDFPRSQGERAAL